MTTPGVASAAHTRAMGRFVYWMNTSLDLLIEGAVGENGGGDWMRIGERVHRIFNERATDLALMVQGRVVYEIMEGFWPAAATDASQPDYVQEYGSIWTTKPKVLVSASRSEASHNTRVIGSGGRDATLAALAEIRAEADGPVGVGGATLATHLLEAGLLDEMLLFVHPVILGGGRALFDRVGSRVECDLVEHEALDDGVTLQRYTIRGAGSSARPA